ncbi:MAG: NACHT domain-containing protein [Hyphomicrobiaceae bacterium]|nr:NACHT domain-containing protein [Hyphomicrobiaceae bacterium]
MNRLVSQATLLEGVIIMTAADDRGRYLPLSDLLAKIKAVRALPGQIHTIAVAKGQKETKPKDKAYKLIKAANYTDLLRQLEENGGLFGDALRQQAREERSALWLPDNRQVDVDWKRLYQIPQLKKVEVISNARLPKEQEKDKKRQRMSVSGYEEALGAEHFQEVESRVPARDLMNQLLEARLKNAVLLGPPGSGKSSLLNWLSVQLAREKPASALRPFPLLVRLAQWEERGPKRSLEDYLALWTKQISPEIPADKRHTFLAEWLNKGRLILLFDGLDEIGEPFFWHFARIINRLKQGKCRFVVSCRTVSRGRYEALDLPIYYIDALTPKQRDAYIDAFPWHDEFAERAEKLKSHLPAASNIHALSCNPLMLSFLCHTLNSSAEISLPFVRAELIGKMLRNMLEQEPAGRSRPEALERTLAELPRKNYRPTTIMTWLGKIAFALFESEDKSSLVFDADRFEKICLKEAGLDDDLLGLFLAEMQWRGIIRPHPGGYMFFHLIIQEYLVALELARRLEKKNGLKKRLSFGGDKKELGEWLYDWSIDPRWEEIMLLTAGLLDEPADYLAHIYDPAHDTLFRHRLSLAARMTGEVSSGRYGQKALKKASGIVLDTAREIWIYAENYKPQEYVLNQINKSVLMLWQRPDKSMQIDHRFQLCIIKQINSSWKVASLFERLGAVAARPEILLALIQALEDGDRSARTSAANALRMMGAVVSENLSRTIPRDEEYWQTRKTEALNSKTVKIKTLTPKMLGFVIGEIEASQNWFINETATEIVERHGIDMPKFIYALAHMLKDEDFPPMSQMIAKVLGKIGVEAATPEVLSALIQKREDTDIGVHITAVASLRMIGAITISEVLSLLTQPLQDSRHDAFPTIVSALTTLGAKAATPATITSLIQALKNNDWQTCAQVVWALEKIGIEAIDYKMLQLIINFASSECKLSRMSGIIRGLSTFGLAANRPPITTLLEECAASDDQPEEVRQAAHDALIKIRGE